jgi:hypothetical protein
LNAIRTGSQVNNPTFQNTPQQQTTQGADYNGAAQNQYGGAMNAYNAQVGQQNQTTNTAASAALMYALMFASDRRLKSNIELLGNDGKYNWYEYDIFGRRERGVMAQEVLAITPEAVYQHPAGYLMVNYGQL